MRGDVGYLVVEILLYGSVFLCSPDHVVACHIGLGTALVVGIDGGVFAAIDVPLVEGSPLVNILHVTCLGGYLVEGHETFVIHASRPQIAGTELLEVGGRCGVAPLCHEIVVGTLCELYGILRIAAQGKAQ